jgi:tetratricopeptide (TPR) repeat protein
MHQYGVRDVEKLLQLPRSTIRSLIDAGFVSPKRGPRRAWLFSFQDLIVLRTAQALAAAKVPRRRITRSMKDLRRHLPEAMPLSGLSICAVGDRVVVREGGGRWQAETGQYVLAFEGDPVAGSLSVVDRVVDRAGIAQAGKSRAAAPAIEPPGADDWFERAVSLESRGQTDRALKAYQQAIAADPAHLDAHINLGRLLHEHGRFDEAERAYCEALKACGNHPMLLYNFGVLLEDLERKPEAMEQYAAALRGNPGLADCHYNLALLYEEHGKPKDAIRHLAQYRRLTRSPKDS